MAHRPFVFSNDGDPIDTLQSCLCCARSVAARAGQEGKLVGDDVRMKQALLVMSRRVVRVFKDVTPQRGGEAAGLLLDWYSEIGYLEEEDDMVDAATKHALGSYWRSREISTSSLVNCLEVSNRRIARCTQGSCIQSIQADAGRAVQERFSMCSRLSEASVLSKAVSRLSGASDGLWKRALALHIHWFAHKWQKRAGDPVRLRDNLFTARCEHSAAGVQHNLAECQEIVELLSRVPSTYWEIYGRELEQIPLQTVFGYLVSHVGCIPLNGLPHLLTCCARLHLTQPTPISATYAIDGVTSCRFVRSLVLCAQDLAEELTEKQVSGILWSLCVFGEFDVASLAPFLQRLEFPPQAEQDRLRLQLTLEALQSFVPHTILTGLRNTFSSAFAVMEESLTPKVVWDYPYYANNCCPRNNNHWLRRLTIKSGGGRETTQRRHADVALPSSKHQKHTATIANYEVETDLLVAADRGRRAVEKGELTKTHNARQRFFESLLMDYHQQTPTEAEEANWITDWMVADVFSPSTGVGVLLERCPPSLDLVRQRRCLPGNATDKLWSKQGARWDVLSVGGINLVQRICLAQNKRLIYVKESFWGALIEAAKTVGCAPGELAAIGLRAIAIQGNTFDPHAPETLMGSVQRIENARTSQPHTALYFQAHVSGALAWDASTAWKLASMPD